MTPPIIVSYNTGFAPKSASGASLPGPQVSPIVRWFFHNSVPFIRSKATNESELSVAGAPWLLPVVPKAGPLATSAAGDDHNDAPVEPLGTVNSVHTPAPEVLSNAARKPRKRAPSTSPPPLEPPIRMKLPATIGDEDPS